MDDRGLNPQAAIAADMAFVGAIQDGKTQADAVRDALRAYLRLLFIAKEDDDG